MIELILLAVIALAFGGVASGMWWSANKERKALRSQVFGLQARYVKGAPIVPVKELDLMVKPLVEAMKQVKIPGKSKRAHVLLKHLQQNPGTPVSEIEESIERILSK